MKSLSWWSAKQHLVPFLYSSAWTSGGDVKVDLRFCIQNSNLVGRVYLYQNHATQDIHFILSVVI